jgi:peptidoglycan/LPS O-acetylase OafA/YrhL
LLDAVCDASIVMNENVSDSAQGKIPLVAFGFRPDLLKGPLSDWLDHFRWISALMVAGSHLRNMLLPDASDLLNVPEKLFYFITLFATESVVIFFVLSGLLVGGAVIRALHEHRFDAFRYAVDRSTRLYVALVPALVLTWILQRLGATVDCQGTIDGPKIFGGSLLFIQNFFVNQPCNNISLWSLSSEAYCYLACPLLIIAIYRRSLLLTSLFCIAILPAISVMQPIRSTPLFGVGLWLCGIVPWFLRVKLQPWLAALPLTATLVVGRLHLFPSELIEEICIAPSFALLLCSDLQQLKAPLPKLAAWFAGFSFSLYLLQMPLVQAFGSIFGSQALPNATFSYFIYAGALTGIIGLAWLFGVTFERRTAGLRLTAMTFFRSFNGK